MPLLRVSASDSGQRPTGPKVRLDLGGKNNLSYSASCEEPTRAACVDPSDKSSWHSGGSFQACFCVHVCVGVCLPWSRSHRVHCSFCPYPPTPHARVLDSTVLRTERGKGPGTSVPVVRGPFPWHLGLLALLAPLEPL